MRVIAAVLLIVGALAVIGGAWLFAPDPPVVANTVPAATPPVAPPVKPPAPKVPVAFEPGDACRIAHRDSHRVAVATSSLWYPRFYQLLVAGDQVGLKKMYEAGQVVFVPAGQRAKVISFDEHHHAEVRIEGGEHDGKALCVMPSCVHRPD